VCIFLCSNLSKNSCFNLQKHFFFALSSSTFFPSEPEKTMRIFGFKAKFHNAWHVPNDLGLASWAPNAHAHFNERHTDSRGHRLTKNKPTRTQLISRFIMRLQIRCALCPAVFYLWGLEMIFPLGYLFTGLFHLGQPSPAFFQSANVSLAQLSSQQYALENSLGNISW